MADKLYIGLDVGSDSVGWAATDEEYNLCRIKGKTAWGARLFDEASDAKGRRQLRTARRRLARRKRRIAWLEEIFREELCVKDPTFLIRLHNSAFVADDKPEEARTDCLIFPTKKEEKEFYKKYPTVWHLRLALLEDKPEAYSDIRLVYLAIHHIIKYRGNFLRQGEINVNNLDDAILDQVNDWFAEKEKELNPEEEDNSYFVLLPEAKYAEFKKLIDLDERKDAKKKMIMPLLAEPTSDKLKNFIDMFVTLSVGGTFDTKKLHDGDESQKLDFSGDFDTKLPDFEAALGDDIQILLLAKQIYDYRDLKNILRGQDGISKAFVSIYDSHKEEKAVLKRIAKNIDAREGLTGDKSIYHKMFVDLTLKDNYPAFIHDKNAKEKRCSIEDFNKFVKDAISPYVESMNEKDKKEWEQLSRLIEKHMLLQTIAIRSTSLIPMQLHERELKKIIENGKKHGIVSLQENGDKLLALFEYKIPYYCGPLRQAEGEETRSNVVFKEGTKKEPITPWNFDEKIDHGKTKKRFIDNLTNSCTELQGEDVLPRNALLFEEYDTYNKINGIKVNSEPLCAEDREALIEHAFKHAKVTFAGMTRFLKARKPAYKDAVISGMSEQDCLSNPSHAFFLEAPFSLNLENRYGKDYKMAERIIFLRTIFADAPKDGIEIIEDEFELSPEQVKALNRLNPKGWGAFSEKFLTLPYANEDGEVQGTLIDVLRESGRVFNMVYNDPKYRFKERVRQENDKKYGTLSTKQRIQEIIDDIPPKMRRSVIQAYRIVEEVAKFGKKDPDAIAIEVTRGPEDEKTKKNKNYDEKGYTQSRKKQIEKFYRDLCKTEDVKVTSNLLKTDPRITDDRLRGKHLYLYFLQNGKDAYSGLPIDINDVLSGTKYDTDHIIPQSFIKDDSIDNLVLVSREANQQRKNRYPIPDEIFRLNPNGLGRAAMRSVWKKWRSAGLMSKKKYENLIRMTALTEDELAGFVNAQINVVNQANITLKKVFEIRYPNTKLIFSKAKFPSRVREKLQIAKLRDLNDTHHAVDAYLNIVTGVELTNRFGDMRIVKAMAKAAKENPDAEVKQSANMERFIKHLITNEDGTPTPFGEKIIKTSERHDFLLTYRQAYADGAFYDQTIYSPGEKSSLIPLHDKEGSPYRDTSKYGGFSGSVAEYNVIVNIHGKKERKYVAPVSHALAMKYRNDREGLEKAILESIELKKGETANVDWKHPLPNGTKLLYGKLPVIFTNMNAFTVFLKPFAPIYLSPSSISYLKDFAACNEKGIVPKEATNDIVIQKKETSYHFSHGKNVEIFHAIKAIAFSSRYDDIPMVAQIRHLESDPFFAPFEGNLIKENTALLSLIALFTWKSKALCKLKLNNYFSKGRGSMFDQRITILNESVTGLVFRPEVIK